LDKVGQVVHYVLEDGNNVERHCPAIIVREWNGGLVNLQVFTDGNGDKNVNDGLPPMVWKTSRANDETLKRPGTWHTIEE
jgi:hypothetical protein